MSEFQTKFLHEVTSMISGFAFKSKHMGIGKSRVVKIKNVVEPHVLVDQCDVLDETQYPAEKIAKFRLIEGDVLISMTGYLGRVATMPPIRETYFLNQRVAKLVPYEARDLAFLKFQLQNEAFKDHCEAFTDSATAQPNISVKSMSQFEIEWPSFENRQAIAEVLSSLDDKIDLLKRQNKTLEGMAEALFRQWFIEEAQDDWEEVELTDLAIVICGKTPDKRNPQYFQGPIPFIKIPDMHGNAFVSATKDSLSFLGSESQQKKLLPPHSILVSCIATVGLVSMNIFPAHTNQQINALIPKKTEYRYFLYCFCKSIYEQLQVLAGGGTATLNLNTRDFGRIRVKIPANTRVSEFHLVAENWFQKIEFNHYGIRLLKACRDVLLPKLMGGEIRIASSNQSDA